MADQQDDARVKDMIAHTPKLPDVDVSERAGHHTGNPRSMDRRLFMQLFVFDCAPDLSPDQARGRLVERLETARTGGVIYEDVNNPRGLGVLTWSEEPATFVTHVRPALLDEGLSGLRLQPSFTMLGRSYAVGYEDDLEYWLLRRPIENAVNPELPWAVWYPLRRTGAFEGLTGKEQAGILREHAAIGRAYGEKDLATDIRLACHGIDANDNEFVIGLIGKNLHPLSHLVQRMRKTVQTRQYIQHMGPFFVGHAVWQKQV